MVLAPAPRRDVLSAGDRADLAASIAGRVVAPGTAEYEELRLVHNRRFDRRPELIVRAENAIDVSRTVRFADETGLSLAVRSGGHSLAGFGTGDGIVLDLSAMKRLEIDPERRVARAQTGLTAGDYTVAAYAHGLATPFGDTLSVGLGGITLGGGIGWLVRKHGLTIDDLLEVELVTADGELVTASDRENADLFWALRGGGGNFGVATSFSYRLHQVGTILGGALILPATREVLREIVPLAAAAPEELSTITMVMRVPPLPFVAPDAHGRLAVIVMAVHAGDPDEGQRALAPFRALARPIADVVAPMPYPGIYQLTEAAAQPAPSIDRSLFLDALDDAAVDAILGRLETASSPMAMGQLRVLGGAMARVPADATAFAFRDARAMFTIITPFEDAADVDRHLGWTEAFFADLRHLSTGVYSNFLADGEERIHEAYPPATLERLVGVKRSVDPTNLFRLNQNIRP